MNSKTVAATVRHAKTASEVYRSFLEKSGADPALFRKYFHLRPTSKGLTVVSTLPEAPMRGIALPSGNLAAALEAKLTALESRMRQLVSDSEHGKEALRELGFPERKNQNALEEGVQASFIRGMVSGEPNYQGIRFVTSELTLGDKLKFDVAGYKDGVLYIFELKKGRSVTAAPQAKTYCNYVEAHLDSFAQVLSVYPGEAVPGISKVKGVAVMAYAENSPYKTVLDWQAAAAELAASEKLTPCISGVDIWLYESAMTFRKLES